MRHYWTGGTLAAALWGTDLQSELVYDGDEGTTEPSGRTRRYGLDLEARIRLTRWLWADADVNLAHGRFRDEPQKVNRIPLAPEVTSTGGLTARDLGPMSGGLRYRHIGSRAADQADSITARGYSVVELFATWQLSRVQGELAPVTELNFTPGAPRTIQVGLDYRF